VLAGGRERQPAQGAACAETGEERPHREGAELGR
jgi:hypothetical protein